MRPLSRLPSWVALVAAPGLGQVAQLLWLVASSRTMSAEEFGTVLGAQALYMALQVLVNAGSWLYGARVAAQQELSDEARARTTRVRLELALLGALGSVAFALAAGGSMAPAVLPYALALVLFALMNTWEPFGTGRRAPYLGYISFRSVTPALVAWALLLAGAAQPVLIPGLAECATIVLASLLWRLMPLRHLRRVLVTRSGARAGILRVSLPQVAAQVLVVTGTLTLSLVGAAASAGMFAAGIKVLGGFATLVGSAALDSFRGLAQTALARDGDGRRSGAGLAAMVTTLSWLSLALMSAFALAAPLLSLLLLDDTSEASVATMMAVLAAIPPTGFVVALTNPLTARGEEATLGSAYLLGVGVMAAGTALVLIAIGPAPAELGAALVVASVAMAIRLVPQARALLAGANVGEQLWLVSAGAGVGLVATFVPALRLPLLALLLAVSGVGLALAIARLLQARRASGVVAAADLDVAPHPAVAWPRGVWPGAGRRLPLRAALSPAGTTAALSPAGMPAALQPPAGPAAPSPPPAPAARKHGGAPAARGDAPVSSPPPAPALGPPPAAARLKPPRRLPSYARSVLTRTRSWSARPRGPEPAPPLRILFYHRVSDERDLLAVRPADFKRQMHLLAAEGYSVLDIASAWDRLEGGDAPARLLALSFDDGYRDFGEHAFPVLERLEFGATVFVCPGLIDGSASMSWYREQPPLLSWDEIAALDGELVRFEPHSISHPNLTAIDTASASREVRESRRVLERRLGRPARVFCYPGGLGGRREQELVAAAGLELAVTCEPGAAPLEANPLALPRTAVQRADSLADFSAKLAGVHDDPLPGRALYRRLRYRTQASAAR